MTDKRKERMERIDKLKKGIHYPECWDTWAYSTVFDGDDMNG